MTIIESYLFLFFDNIMASLAFVNNSGMVYDLMYIFKGFNETYMILIAILGNTIGSSINYMIGKSMHSIKKCSIKNDSKKFISLSNYMNQKLFFIAAFSFLTIFGVIITVAAGFLKVEYKRFVFAVILGRILYYVVPILAQ